MSLSKIYASKIYLTSSRQDKIHAAMQDPLNVELVQQISDYLDDGSKKELANAIKSKQSEVQDVDNQVDDSSGNVFDNPEPSHSNGGSSSAPHHFSGGGGSAPDMNVDPFGDVPEDDPFGEAPTENSNSDSSSEVSDTSTEVEEATEITGVNDIDPDTDDTPVLQSGIIKKLLNETDDASGVARVDISDDEAWIYYNDKINLNDVLDNVISIIKSSGYDMLKFSRLARTDNAVVFDIKE